MTTPSHSPAAPLQFLMPGWFALVMGLAGLSLAWSQAAQGGGTPVVWAAGVASALGWVALGVFGVLALLSAWRIWRHGDAWREDLAHPVRHAFVAAMPISLMLLATVGVAQQWPSGWLLPLWKLGAALQLLVMVWVLSRWLRPAPQGFQWAGITPVLFIPVVGNVLAPLAGVALGEPEWAAAQMGVGLLFWPVVLTLLVVRIGQVGMWPDRLLPTTFITLAPPAVVGLAASHFNAPAPLLWLLWGMGLFFLLWALTLWRRLLVLPFGVPFWGMSFPLAAFSALTLRLSQPAPAWLAGAGWVLLLATSAVVAFLCVATLRGLWRGTLLVPEMPPPAVQPLSAGTGS